MKDKLIVLLLFSTIFVNSITFFTTPFEGYLYYLVVILFLPVFSIYYGIPIKPMILLIYPMIIGLINLLLGNIELFNALKVTGGMMILLPFYYYFIEYFDGNVHKIYTIYLKWCYVVAIVGIIQSISYVIGFEPGYDYRWLLDKSSMSPGSFGLIRVNSFLLEPSAIARSLAPAYFIALRRLLGESNDILPMTKGVAISIVAVTILSFSSLAYIGVLISIIFIFIEKGRIQYLLFGFGIIFSLSVFAYNFVDEVKFRVDAFYGLIVLQEYNMDNVNSSSFVLWNNATVAWENMTHHPFGTGLGSHNVAFERYSLTRRMQILQRENNYLDANSTFLRIMSEMGIPGMLFIIIVLYRYHVPITRSDKFSVMSNGLLVMILIQMFRQGNYFVGGFPLIMLMYYYNGKQYMQFLKNGEEELVEEEEEGAKQVLGT